MFHSDRRRNVDIKKELDIKLNIVDYSEKKAVLFLVSLLIILNSIRRSSERLLVH